jgi:hypothetical protein
MRDTVRDVIGWRPSVKLIAAAFQHARSRNPAHSAG